MHRLFAPNPIRNQSHSLRCVWQRDSRQVCGLMQQSDPCPMCSPRSLLRQDIMVYLCHAVYFHSLSYTVHEISLCCAKQLLKLKGLNAMSPLYSTLLMLSVVVTNAYTPVTPPSGWTCRYVNIPQISITHIDPKCIALCLRRLPLPSNRAVCYRT
jgi:hypothetical protein